MAGIALVSNPYSKKNRKKPQRLEKLKQILPDQSLAQFPTSFKEMDASLEMFKKRKIDILAVNGGDGTIHVALTRLIKVYGNTKLPKLAILKGGTMNQTATACKIKGSTEQILSRVVKAYESDRNLKTVNKALLNIEEKYGFIFANGLACNFMDIYHAGGDPSPLVAATSVIKTIGSMMVRGPLYKKLFKPLKAEIIADGFSYDFKPYLAIFLATISEVGLGFQLWKRAKGDCPHIHMLGVKEKASLIPQMPRIFFGRSLNPRHIDDTIGSEFVVKCDQPFSYTIDGDMFNCDGTLLIKKGPRIDIITE